MSPWIRGSVLFLAVMVLAMYIYTATTGRYIHEGWTSSEVVSESGNVLLDDKKDSTWTGGVLSDLGSDIDEAILAGNFVDKEAENIVDDLSLDPEDQFELPSTDISANDFKEMYEEVISSNSIHTKVAIAEALYRDYGYTSALPILVELLISLRRFDDALSYIQESETIGPIDDVFDTDLILYLMFNSLDLHFKNFNRIKNVIQKYEEEGRLSVDDHNFYFALVALAKSDLANYSYYMDLLKGTAYSDWYDRFEERKEQVSLYWDVPDYYMLGLLGIDAYAYGWYQVSELVAAELIKQDNKYLLGYQLAAYSNMMLGNWENALKSLKYLEENESDHVELYGFLQGIVLFEMGMYQDAIFLFNKVKQSGLERDALRYKLLAYDHIDDTDNIFDVWRLMLGDDVLIVHDYYTIFEMLLYKKSQDDQDYSEEQMQVLSTTLSQCYDDLEREYAFVCLYGKAGMFLLQGEMDRARVYLERLVVRYKKPYIFEDLGDLYAEGGDYDNAKKWYLQGLSYTQLGGDSYEEMRTKVMSTVLQIK